MDSEKRSISLKSLLEGLLFMAGEEGLSVISLQSACQNDSRNDIEKALKELQSDYSSQQRGLLLCEFAGRWKIVAREEVYPYARMLYQQLKAPVLSAAALETLALIAYRQPITRIEIEEIRGVSSDVMLKKLQARGLVETCGRLDAPGKPLLYRVTDLFLDVFGLDGLDELPGIEENRQENLFEEIQADIPTEKAGNSDTK